MTYAKPDGTIELGGSGCCCPPGQRRPGMHTNSTTSWWRINDGEWHRLNRDARVLACAADTCAEFEEAMNQETRL